MFSKKNETDHVEVLFPNEKKPNFLPLKGKNEDSEQNFERSNFFRNCK